jgi:hypothetical protein
MNCRRWILWQIRSEQCSDTPGHVCILMGPQIILVYCFNEPSPVMLIRTHDCRRGSSVPLGMMESVAQCHITPRLEAQFVTSLLTEWELVNPLSAETNSCSVTTRLSSPLTILQCPVRSQGGWDRRDMSHKTCIQNFNIVGKLEWKRPLGR